MSKLETLIAKLQEQSVEMEKTVRELEKVAHASNSHELKYLALTQIGTGHFGLNGLQTDVEKLAKMKDKLS